MKSTATIPTLKTALPALALAALLSVGAAAPAHAASDFPQITADTFQDLPGVQALGQQERPSQRCELVTRQEREIRIPDGQSWRARRAGTTGMPYQVYRCEQDGYVYEGANPPTRDWFPGANPRHLLGPR